MQHERAPTRDVLSLDGYLPQLAIAASNQMYVLDNAVSQALEMPDLRWTSIGTAQSMSTQELTKAMPRP